MIKQTNELSELDFVHDFDVLPVYHKLLIPATQNYIKNILNQEIISYKKTNTTLPF